MLAGELLKLAGVPLGQSAAEWSRATRLRAPPDGYQAVFAVAELDPGFTSSDVIVADT